MSHVTTIIIQIETPQMAIAELLEKIVPVVTPYNEYGQLLLLQADSKEIKRPPILYTRPAEPLP